MADSSAFAGLLDRANDVFGLARALAYEFHQEFRGHSPVNIIWDGEENPRQRHREKINEFIAAVQRLREETKNPPEGFAEVAEVLRRCAATAKLMATSPHWDPLESWPYLNQHAQDGYFAAKAARAAMPKDDLWDFSESKPAVESDATPNPVDSISAPALAPPGGIFGGKPGDEAAGPPRGPMTNLAAPDETAATTETAPAAAMRPRRLSAPKPKRSTEKGEGRVKLIAALTKHHQYAGGSCMHQDAIGNNELARLADVSDSTASAFFNREFNRGEGGGHAKYRATCGDSARLIAALKLLNQEFSPHHLFGVQPPGEAYRDED